MEPKVTVPILQRMKRDGTKITTHRFGLKDTDAAIKAVGASEGVIHVSLLPWD